MSKKWRYNRIVKTAAFAFLAANIATADAQAPVEYQDASSLKSAVMQAITDNLSNYPYQNLQISVRSIDKRLRLKRCDADLTATVTNPSQRLGRVTTEVHCGGPTSWKIYVQATVTAEMEVPVLSRSLPRGALIGAEDVQLNLIQLGQQQQPIAETIEALVGMELRRAANSGQPVLLSQITAPDVIKRGQQVSIRYAENDLNISMSGKALQNGAKGDWIPVENASSGRRIEGRVERDGSIVIPGF